jgi:hypothetical protein
MDEPEPQAARELPRPQDLPAVAAYLLEQVDVIDDRVQLIETYLDKLDREREEAKKKPPVPRPWADRATEQHWAELVDWVDWLLRTYQPANEYSLAACWPAHPGAVEHLAALRYAWKAAMLQDEKPPNDAAAYWHKNCLWPLLSDVSKVIPNSCRSGHNSAERRTPMTDRSLLPSGEPETTV